MMSKYWSVGNWLRSPLRLVPRGLVIPILTGPARGLRWVVGAGTHGCWIGTYELEKQHRIASLLKPGNCFLDVGANAGFYALQASRLVGPSGRVFAFEPLPANVLKLRRHINLNGLSNVTVINAAVCDQDGRAAFQIGAADECGGLATSGSLEVDTVSLDQMWALGHLKSPQIIKIDVEGAEARVLQGARTLIRDTRPTILLAGHGTATQRTCEAILRDYGYVVTMDRDGRVDGMYESTAAPARREPPSGNAAIEDQRAADGATAANCAPLQANAPRVSVVMSVYNEAERVGRAIDSLLHQTFADFELIVVDDGSRDRTSVILGEYRQRDPRIRVITQQNTGLTRALIRGCAAARGEYIARQDADDWSMPTRLAAQVNVLDADPAIGLVSCAAQCIGPEGEPLEQVCYSFDPAEATDKLLNQRIGPPAHGSVTFRRTVYETVGGYRAEFYFGQDSDLWMRMAETSHVAYLPELLYVFRRDVKTISGHMGHLQRQFGAMGQACRSARREGRPDELILLEARQLTDRIRSRKGSTGFSRGGSSMAYLIGSSLAKQGHPRASRYLWLAICFNPLNWRAWARFLAHSVVRSHCDIQGSQHE